MLWGSGQVRNGATWPQATQQTQVAAQIWGAVQPWGQLNLCNLGVPQSQVKGKDSEEKEKSQQVVHFRSLPIITEVNVARPSPPGQNRPGSDSNPDLRLLL